MQRTGFDSPECLNGMTEANLIDLENHISENKRIVENIAECLHIKNYQDGKNFKFLPGHKTLILNLSQGVNRDTNLSTNSIMIEHPAFSPLLRSSIKTALNNHEKIPTQKRYPDLLKDFSIYLYIMAGRACYEVIAANLPLPSASTICT